MRYEGNIFRPPSEAYSYILQVTVGCSHNKCRFCSMYKDKKFHVRKMEDVFEDIEMARRTYGRIKRIFIADGDALCLATYKLVAILDKLRETFPECERITSYGSAKDVNRKSAEELSELHEHGLAMIYIGAESGSDKVLKAICKGSTAEELITAVRKIEDSGIQASVTFISGLAGRDGFHDQAACSDVGGKSDSAVADGSGTGWRDHAISTGRMISKMSPSYVGLLTLMTEPMAPMTRDIAEGKIQLLTPEEVLAETALMLENTNVFRPCVFRSNHASNYLNLRGTLPKDKDRMLAELRHAMKNTGILKDERFRML